MSLKIGDSVVTYTPKKVDKEWHMCIGEIVGITFGPIEKNCYQFEVEVIKEDLEKETVEYNYHELFKHKGPLII